MKNCKTDLFQHKFTCKLKLRMPRLTIAKRNQIMGMVFLVNFLLLFLSIFIVLSVPRLKIKFESVEDLKRTDRPRSTRARQRRAIVRR